MAKNKNQCGPNAVDEYENYEKFPIGNDCYRNHYVTGTGKMIRCHTMNKKNYGDHYHIYDGITELADKCFDSQSIYAVYLPSTLVKIGSSCFRKASFSSIDLPDSLEEMGNRNFPASLESLSLPANLRIFPTDNIQDCKKLTAIYVNQNNKYFKSIEGILYNHDVTEILICPRGKAGKVFIPDTVKHIADYCFEGCSKITSIELPRSIETIGRYAFSDLMLENLVIPNSVIEIGEGCFNRLKVNQKFRLSQRITRLPDYCFEDATIHIPNSEFLNKIEKIGKYCFASHNGQSMLPVNLRLPKIKEIGEHAFYGASNLKTIEIPSCIQYIGECAFSSTSDEFKFIFLSMEPLNTDNNAFYGLSDKATLFVPNGSKILFKKSRPWAMIPQIVEYDPEKGINDDDKSDNDELLYYRLQNIVSSLANADRDYLTEIMQELAMYYQNVEDEDEYNEVMQIIQYNYRFNPPLIPNFGKDLCSDWPNKYKLTLVYHCIMNSQFALLDVPNQDAEFNNIIAYLK